MGLFASGAEDPSAVAAWDGAALAPELASELAPALAAALPAAEAPALAPAVVLPGLPKPCLARISWPVFPVTASMKTCAPAGFSGLAV